MVIYNTLSGKKEHLLPPKSKKKLQMFVCGPTVYDRAHIGHARTYIFFDAVKRYLNHIGYNITYIQNITDIDDKIIDSARKKNIEPLKLSKYFEKQFLSEMKKIGIISVDQYARATKYISEIIEQIRILLENKKAYIIKNDGIYFDLMSFPDYGQLSRRTALHGEDATSRIDEGINKKNKGDFVLWKFAKIQKKEEIKKNFNLTNGEPSWKSPWGLGRPGWHIEDTAITEKYFGPQYDIHGGGLDLKFPHHEAEIAIQESISGLKPFVNFWMHTGFLLVKGKKMSKSLKNFITIKEFLNNYEPNVLRMMVLTHHYRSPVDYSNDLTIQSACEWNSILQFISRLSTIKKVNSSKKTSFVGANTRKKLDEVDLRFNSAMQDDFNTPKAFASLHLFVNEFQASLHKLNYSEASEIVTFLKNHLKLLGFTLKLPKIANSVQKLAKKRELLRSNKQFIQADDLRNKIYELGYTLDDTPLGPFIWPRITSK